MRLPDSKRRKYGLGVDRKMSLSLSIGCGVLLLVGLATRIVLGEFILARDQQRLPDSFLYEAFAESIYRGESYHAGDLRAARTPGYPFFIATCWRCFGKSDRAILHAQALIATLSGLLVFGVVRQWELGSLPVGSAFSAILLATFEPFGIGLSALILSESLFGFFLLLAAWTGVMAAARRSVGWSLAAGLAAGAAILVRPSGLLLAPLAAMLWIARSGDRGRTIRLATAAVIGTLLVLGPWWLRNSQVLGVFVPTTLNVGVSLYDGLRPGADGGSDMVFEKETPAGLTEAAVDLYWRDRAVAAVRENPLAAIRLSLRKFVRFWSPWPNADEFRNPALVVLTAFASMGIFGLAAYGGWIVRRQWFLLALALTPALYFCALHLVFVSSVRYRVPAMPFLCMLAGVGLATIVARIRPAAQ